MTLLAGSEATQATAEVTEVGKIEAASAPVSVTGVLQTLSLLARETPTCSNLKLGVYADDGSRERPGAFLAKGETGTKPAANAWATVTLATWVAVTVGDLLWFAILPLGGKMRWWAHGLGAGSEGYVIHTNTGAYTDLGSLLSAEWQKAPQLRGPASFYGSGVAGGGRPAVLL